MTALGIKAGDRRPYFRATLKDHDGNAIDLNASDIASVTFNFIAVDATDATVDDGTTNIVQSGSGSEATDKGVVEYQWASSDTDTVGRYKADFKITYDDGTWESYPSDDYEYIEIIPAIGD